MKRPAAVGPPLIAARLRNQRLAQAAAAAPAKIVAHFGAVQSQDYAGAAWALGLRLKSADESTIDRAFAAGAILRTHILRPTWHFVAAADFRWLLALSGPRVNAMCAGTYRRLGVDDGAARRSRRIFEREIGRRGPLTRAELCSALVRGGRAIGPLQLAHLMLRAELDGVVCSGPRRERQFTYALVEERAPRGDARTRDEALAELATRYFTSHGPATVRDYAWWSGLTSADAKRGIDIAGAALECQMLGERVYWTSASAPRARPMRGPAVHLLPNYDEYVIAYRHRDPVVIGPRAANIVNRGVDPFPHHLVVDGVVAGSWRRTDRAGSVAVTVTPYRRLGAAHVAALDAAVARLGRFAGRAAALELTAPRKPAA